MASTPRRGNDAVAQDLETLDTRLDAIAGLEWPDPGRGAGENQVAGLELVQLRQRRDDVWHVPHHLAHVRLLAQLVVELEPDASVRYVSEGGGTNRGDGSGMVEALGRIPGLATLARRVLQVAACQIVSRRVAEHLRQRVPDADVAATAAECHHQFALIVKIGALGRIG